MAEQTDKFSLPISITPKPGTRQWREMGEIMARHNDDLIAAADDIAEYFRTSAIKQHTAERPNPKNRPTEASTSWSRTQGSSRDQTCTRIRLPAWGPPRFTHCTDWNRTKPRAKLRAPRCFATYAEAKINPPQ